MASSENDNKNSTVIKNDLEDKGSPFIQLELERIRLEREKLEIEKNKGWLKNNINFTIIIPVVVALIAMYQGLSLQNEQNNAEMQLKVADLITNSDKPDEAQEKARAIAVILNGSMDRNFIENINEFAEGEFGQKRDPEKRMELLKLLKNENYSEKEYYIDLWHKLGGPSDKRLELIKLLLDSPRNEHKGIIDTWWKLFPEYANKTNH